MTMTNKDGTVVGASHHLETNTHLGMDDGGPIASPPAASRRERREALSPYRRGRGDARTPRRPTSATNDVSPTSGNILKSLGSRISAFFGYTPRKPTRQEDEDDQELEDGHAEEDETDNVELDAMVDADAPAKTTLSPQQPQRATPLFTFEPTTPAPSTSSAERPKPVFPKTSSAAPNGRPMEAAQSSPFTFSLPAKTDFKPAFTLPTVPAESSSSSFGFGGSSSAATTSAPVPAFGTPWKPSQGAAVAGPSSQLAVTPFNAPNKASLAAQTEKYERAQARMRELYYSCKGRDMTHAEKEEWDRLMEVPKPDASQTALSAVGSPFLFLPPPTPSAGKLFTPVRTGVAATSRTALDSPRNPGSAVRRRQDVRYYGVGFSQRNTPNARRPAPLRGPGAVRGNAARAQTSLFESMDIQAAAPAPDFGTFTEPPSVPSATSRPTAWSVARDEEVEMAVDAASKAPSRAPSPRLSQPTLAATAAPRTKTSPSGPAEILRNIIKETSPPGKGAVLSGSRTPRLLRQNPYMVTEDESAVAIPPPILKQPVPPIVASTAAAVTAPKPAPAFTFSPAPRAAEPQPAKPPTFTFGTPAKPVVDAPNMSTRQTETPVGAPAFSFTPAPKPGPSKDVEMEEDKSSKPADNGKEDMEEDDDDVIILPTPPKPVFSAKPPTFGTLPASKEPEPPKLFSATVESKVDKTPAFSAPVAKENIITNEVPATSASSLLSRVKDKVKRQLPDKTAYSFTSASGDKLALNGELGRVAKKVKVAPITEQFDFKKSAPPATFNYGAAGFAAPKTEGWECEVCMVKNPVSALDKCVSCESPKPAEQPKAAAAPSGGGFNFAAAGYSPKTDGWKCDLCAVSNPATADKCAACETPKPAAAPTASAGAPTGGFNFAAAGFSVPKTDGWKCSLCSVTNPTTAEKCAACESPNPNSAPKTAAALPSGGFNFAAAGFTAPKTQGWTCSVCMVPNPATAAKCVACESNRP